MVWGLALKPGDPGFKTFSDHSLNLILVVPSSTQHPTGLPPASWEGFLAVVVVFCRFVNCVSMALTGLYGEWTIKYVL